MRSFELENDNTGASIEPPERCKFIIHPPEIQSFS